MHVRHSPVRVISGGVQREELGAIKPLRPEGELIVFGLSAASQSLTVSQSEGRVDWQAESRQADQ